jgi:hypothetical protein
MKFKSNVFEKLLFPLNQQVYRKIQSGLDEIDENHSGQLERIIEIFNKAARSDTQTALWVPGKADETLYPSLDIFILFSKIEDHKFSSLRKSTDYRILFNYDERTPSRYTGSHLVLNYYQNSAPKTYIIPLAYLLGFNEKIVLKEGSYQLYSHNILSTEKSVDISENFRNTGKDNINVNYHSAQKSFQKDALVYVGITRRTWQERYRQHCHDAGRGSNLLFHRALRGEFCKIGSIEHIVERAGLTEKQAMEIEEGEVEKRSLRSLHPTGLNMIPGGYAGLKCVHHYAARTGYIFQRELTADTVESVLVEVQRHSFEKHFKTAILERVNAEIARLWAENIDFRINVMTHRQNRFSFPQIQAAQIWYASGWLVEKILAYLQKLDADRIINAKQLERLLSGKTYASIPEVLM